MKWPWSVHKPAEGYRIFTTRYDVETTGDALSKTLTPQQRKDWDKQVAIYEQATKLTRTTASANGLEHVDKVLGSDGFDPSQTAVSVLIDHSGSLRGQKAMITCLIAEIIADFLARLHLRYEILGFTTAAWKGGQSRALWQLQLSPKDPGRLNDLLHIVYRDAGATSPGAPYTLRHILREDLLKENIDGEALFWASERLKNLDTRRNLIIMISDGAPVDDSTLSANHPHLLWDHLNLVIEDIHQTSGMDLAGIGVDHDVSELFPTSLRIDQLAALPDILPRFLADLLTAETMRSG